MAGLLISGPAGAGKSAAAREVLAARLGLTVLADFQSLYAALLLLVPDPETGRYPERDPDDAYLLPTAEYLRRAIITTARTRGLFVVVTNSDGSPTRRAELLDLIGDGATERVINPGLDVVRRRLSVNGVLSQQCADAVDRWFGRLTNG